MEQDATNNPKVDNSNLSSLAEGSSNSLLNTASLLHLGQTVNNSLSFSAISSTLGNNLKLNGGDYKKAITKSTKELSNYNAYRINYGGKESPNKEGIISTSAGFVDALNKYVGNNISSIDSNLPEDISNAMKHFSNSLLTNSFAGGLTEIAARNSVITNKIEDKYDPTKDVMFDHLIEGLDNDQVTNLIENYSDNQNDFYVMSDVLKGHNKRKEEMKAYAEGHPAIAGASFMYSMMSDAIMLTPVTSAIATGATVSLAKQSLKSLSAFKKYSILAGVETLEQGALEVGYNKLYDEYETSPYLFLGGVAFGTGIRKFTWNATLEKTIDDLLVNEKGMVKLLSKEAQDEFASVVAKESDSESAVRAVEELNERRNNIMDSIQKDLIFKTFALREKLNKAKIALKSADKGTSKYKAIKGQIQKWGRILEKQRKINVLTLKKVADGTHPRLNPNINVHVSIKSIGKDLGIPEELYKSPAAIRRWTGVDKSDFGENVIIEGEEGWEGVANAQLREMSTNKRLNVNHMLNLVNEKMTGKFFTEYSVGKFLKDTVYKYGHTDTWFTKVALNKGNLVNSDNKYVSAFFNWYAPDAMGRQGMSKIRAGEKKNMLSSIYIGELMTAYKEHGTRLMKHLNKDGGIAKKGTTYFGESIEEITEPIFKKRIMLGKERFAELYPSEEIRDIADNFAEDWNKINRKVVEDGKFSKVKDMPEYKEDYFHTEWSSEKARDVDVEALNNAIYEGMQKALKDKNIAIDADVIKENSRKFSYGIRSKDLASGERAGESYLESLKKFKEGEIGSSVQGDVNKEIARVEANKANKELAELGHKELIDLDTPIEGTDLHLYDLLEDNIVHTQRKYLSRMSARIAAADGGIKDINQLNSWIKKAVTEERARLKKMNATNIEGKTKWLENVMNQELMQFKYNSIGSRGDVVEEGTSNFLRLLKKITVANLMAKTPIAGIAEGSGNVVEAGMFNAVKQYAKAMGSIYRKNHFTHAPEVNISNVADDMTALAGFGYSDVAFTSRGVSKAEKIYKKGLGRAVEDIVDNVTAFNLGALGGIEKANRIALGNHLAIKWGKVFKGETDNIIGHALQHDSFTKRSLENLGLGTYVKDANGVEVFKLNSKFEKIRSNYLKHVEFDANGTPSNMHMDLWDKGALNDFRDVIRLQHNHIFVDPDSSLSAYWQNTTFGRIFSQFTTFSRNAKSKIAAFHLANVANGIKHNDMDEVMKFGNHMFWASMMGTLAIALRDELNAVGTGKDNVTLSGLLDNPLQEIAVGFSRSSAIGDIDVINGVGATIFGYDNIFNRSSFTGRDKNFLNLGNKPIGRLGVSAYSGLSSIVQGDSTGFKKSVNDITPFSRMLFIQQAINTLK